MGTGRRAAARGDAESGEWRVNCFAISPSSSEMPVPCRGDNDSGCRGLVPPGICLKWSCLSNPGPDAPRQGKWGKAGVGWGRRGPGVELVARRFSYSLELGGCPRSPAEFQDIKATSGAPSQPGRIKGLRAGPLPAPQRSPPLPSSPALPPPAHRALPRRSPASAPRELRERLPGLWSF